MGGMLIHLGILLIIVGCVVQLLGGAIPFGHLPGDISITGKHGSFYFPVVTCIVISVVLNIILRLFR